MLLSGLARAYSLAPREESPDVRGDPSEGRARIDGIEAGECLVTFPALDQEAWGRVG
jgi:hypothetical protein